MLTCTPSALYFNLCVLYVHLSSQGKPHTMSGTNENEIDEILDGCVRQMKHLVDASVDLMAKHEKTVTKVNQNWKAALKVRDARIAELDESLRRTTEKGAEHIQVLCKELSGKQGTETKRLVRELARMKRLLVASEQSAEVNNTEREHLVEAVTAKDDIIRDTEAQRDDSMLQNSALRIQIEELKHEKRNLKRTLRSVSGNTNDENVSPPNNIKYQREREKENMIFSTISSTGGIPLAQKSPLRSLTTNSTPNSYQPRKVRRSTRKTPEGVTRRVAFD